MPMRQFLGRTRDRMAAVKAAIEDLVQLRNDLVHHLIERFDVWTDDGCAAAVEHLRRSYERIDGHVHELRQWAQIMAETGLVMASSAKSQPFQDFILDGIAPDGAVDWPHAGIVRALHEAVKSEATDGWLRLKDAQVWMSRHHPEQLPERYGCRTWPQVLSKSRAFQLEYRPEGRRKVAWFCALR